MVRNRLLSRTDNGIDSEDTMRTPVTEDVRYDEGDVAPATEVAEPVERKWAHVSAAATIALIVGLSAVYAALTGILAPVAVALGVIGLLFSMVGFAAVSRAGVTGHSLATLGLIASAAGIVLGILAIRNVLPWLHHTDQVANLRHWLEVQLPWMKSW